MAWEEFGKYMKALARDLKRAVLSMINAFKTITSGSLRFQRNVLYCNGLRQGSGYLNELGGKRFLDRLPLWGKPKKKKTAT